MNEEFVDCLIDGPVARIRLTRPDVGNALSRDVLRGLGRSLARVQADRAVRVLVLESEGDRAFCAGGDLGEMRTLSSTDPLPGSDLFAEILKGMRKLSAVVIARVQGPAFGGGLGLLLASDLAVASTRARFGTPEVGVGLFPMMVLAPLVRHLPPKILARLVFTGEPLSAEDAYRWGLINEVVEPEMLDSAIKGFVDSALHGSPTALRRGRAALNAAIDLPYEQAVDYLHSMLENLWRAGEAEEGIRAFLAREKPDWVKKR